MKIIGHYQSVIYLNRQNQKDIDDDNLVLFVSEPMKCSNADATGVGYSLGAVNIDAVALPILNFGDI